MSELEKQAETDLEKAVIIEKAIHGECIGKYTSTEVADWFDQFYERLKLNEAEIQKFKDIHTQDIEKWKKHCNIKNDQIDDLAERLKQAKQQNKRLEEHIKLQYGIKEKLEGQIGEANKILNLFPQAATDFTSVVFRKTKKEQEEWLGRLREVLQQH